MTPSFLQVKNITDTLPIGFYANRRIVATLAEGEECSYYAPLEDTIVISYDQLCQGLEVVPDERFEEIIRSNFYHEVSHAILTPKRMNSADIYNIFEDERIETLLANYYYGINFKETIKAICHYDPTSPYPTDPLQAFFVMVRFRRGPKEFTDRVDKIIQEYKLLNRADWPSCYENDIKKLFEDFCQAMGHPDFVKLMEQTQTQSGDSDGEQAQGENTIDQKGRGHCPSKGTIDPEVKNMIVNDILNNPNDFNPEFHQVATTLFQQYNRKNSKGMALQGHSGVINPRLADRQDYRMFERSASARGNNQFGSFHLNLFIDVSGSFFDNEVAVNAMLKSLAIIERTNKNFTFDVIGMGRGEQVLDRKKRFIDCGGGNYLDSQIFEIYRKLQLPQTYNYNIVLFDGDAYSSSCPNRKYILTCGKGFSAFAHNNCSIISDIENQNYITQYCPNTSTIYTQNYVAELTDNIIKILQFALN